MKKLRIFLALIYVVIIILLLLSLKNCCNKEPASEPGPVTEEPVEEEEEPVVIKEKFNADVVMCIDCTGSMSRLIGTIKDNALNFYPDMKRRCKAHGKEILSMRIRVIGFRDVSDSQSMQASGFFKMPEQESDFKSCVSRLRSDGGGDEPELGYDAIATALQSPWSSQSDVRRVVIVWTDASSKPLTGRTPGGRNFTDLTNTWKTKMGSSKKLILFAPSHPTWNTIVDDWDNAKRHDVSSGGGLSEVDYDEIIKALSESI